MPTNLSDRIASKIITQTVDLLRVADGMIKPILRSLNLLESELISDLEDVTGKTDFTVGRLRALLAQTRATIATAYKKITVMNEKGLIAAVDAVGIQTVNAANTAIGASVLSVGWSQRQIESIAKDVLLEGHVVQDWWSQQSAALRNRFAAEMRIGQLRGESIDQLVQRVRGTKAMAFKDGIMQASRFQARTLVRTAVIGVSNDARLQSYLDNREVVKGVRWLSTLDNRTTEICIALDGAQWEFPKEGEAHVDYRPIGDNKKQFEPPPAHWNCRSVLVPITFSWEELAGAHGNSAAAKIADQIPDATRSSMDGQVGSKMTMDDWLKTRTDAEIDAQLGAGKAQLWRDGKISLTQLTDTRNNPLPISEITKRAQPWIDHVEGMPFDTKKFYTQADGTFTAERRALHESIIQKFFANVTPVTDEERLAVLMQGGTASGKSSFVNEFMGKNVVRIDADAIKEFLPEYQAGVAAKARDVAEVVHEESSVLAIEIRDRAIKGKFNLIFDGTGANADKYSVLFETLKSEGYVTRLVAIDTEVEEAILRAGDRAESKGRWVPEKFIRETYAKIPASFAQNSKLADGFMLFDNNQIPPRLVWARTEDGEIIYDKAFAKKYGFTEGI